MIQNKEKRKKVSTKNTTSNTYYNQLPVNKEISKYQDVASELSSRTIEVFEIVKGHSIILDYNSKSEYFYIDYEDPDDKKETNIAFTTMEANCNDKAYKFYDNIHRLKTFLGSSKIDFKVFGEFIDANTQREKYLKEEKGVDFFITDIYINSNWICTDDIELLCEKSKLKSLPKLYHGKFNEKAINTLADGKSVINQDVDRYAVYIKPILEDKIGVKRIAAILLNDKYATENTDSDFNKALYDKVANEMIKKHLNTFARENVFNLASTGCSTKPKHSNLRIVNNDKEKVIKTCVYSAMNIYLIPKMSTYIYKYLGSLNNYKEVEEKVKKSLKKKLPKIFIDNYYKGK